MSQSITEPTAEHWRQACHEIVYQSRHVKMFQKIEARANELAGNKLTPEEQSLREALGLGIGGRGVAEY